MVEHQSRVLLKLGEVVDLSVICGADAVWLEPIQRLFAHKGEPWAWQNCQFLTSNVGFDTRYYVLHRSGTPFAATLLSEYRGIGILNHVWTNPEDRGKGASSSLMQHLMDGFKTRQNKMMVLQTGFDSVAYHLYRKVSFESLEPGSGYMHLYTASEAAFYKDFFSAGEVQITPLGWPHWLTVQPLLQGDFGDVVRSPALKQLGRRSTESAILSLLQDEALRREQHLPPRAVVLQSKATDAVLGFALWNPHPLWLDTCLIDLYCHPEYWRCGSSLLERLQLPKAERYVVFADEQQGEKQSVLGQAVFRRVAILESWVAKGFLQTSFANVLVYQK